MIKAFLLAVVVATPIGAPIAVAITSSAPLVSADDQCGDGYEWSKTASTCLPIPSAAPTAPPGATFLCTDGDYSYSKTSKGACSRHGGVKAEVGQ
jgi:hypothetical protein